jgi:hypothetical protein
MILRPRDNKNYMQENIERTKKTIISIVSTTDGLENKLEQLNQLLVTLNPLRNTEEQFLVCDAAILCADKLGKTEMIAQLLLIKAKAEISKAGLLIHEMKNLTLALGWFSFALKSEKNRYDELEKRVQEIWNNTQKYINTGFEYLNKKPYIGVAGYCQKITGEIYGSLYLQLKLYHFVSGRPWRARIAGYKIVRFSNLDDTFLLDRKSRDRIKEVRCDCMKCFKEAIKYYKQEKAWVFLADCYISLGLEHHSFNSPFRSKIALYRAERLIKKYKIVTLWAQLKQIRALPWIGSDRD